MEKIIETNSKNEKENVFPIEIISLKKSYGKKEVLKGISLTVNKGEIFAFIGKNGVGKSTTIDCVIGLKRSDSGIIKINGYDILKQPLNAKREFGYVSSDPITYETMTGKEYLEFIASAYRLDKDTFFTNYETLINLFSLSLGDLNRKIKEYSHGMKQKICLIASLIHNPDIWILDEPTVGLDIITSDVLTNLFKQFKNENKTVFITSHNIDLIKKVADRVAIIKDGLILKLIDLNLEKEARENLDQIFLEIYK